MSRTNAAGLAADEFEQRRAAAMAAAGRAGFDGLLVCGRGGGGLDRYGDVFYLTNHYSSFPYIPDLPGAWTGRAHSFLVMPVGSDPVLVVDIPYIEKIRMPAEQIVVADLVTEAVIEAMRSRLPSGRIGLVGGDTLPANMAKALEAALPGCNFEPADAILSRLRAVKSPAEIDKLRRASEIGSRMIDAMMEAAVPGATHADVVAAGMAVLIPAGGMLYNSFMASGSAGTAPKVVRHNFPTWGAKEPLASGDWFRIGISGVLDGYCFDLARARPIGPASSDQISAFEAAIAVVEAGIEAIRPGATAGDVAAAGNNTQERLGFTFKGVFSGLGHGLGLGWDSPWLVPGEPTVLEPNMVFCVEKTLMRDGFLGDFEETVLLTENGTERLTNARKRYW